MSMELLDGSQSSSAISTVQFYSIHNNSDPGARRFKSLHFDMVFSPATSATRPVVMDCVLHRHHLDLATSNLSRAEGTRVKFERLTVGRGTDRYYRMWAEAINLEFGYELTLVVDPIDITGGAPSFALGRKSWELVTD